MLQLNKFKAYDVSLHLYRGISSSIVVIRDFSGFIMVLNSEVTKWLTNVFV